MKKKAISNIKSGDFDDAQNTLEGISSIADIQPEGTLNALKEIYGHKY